MVFVVVAEKKATEKSPQMIFILRSAFVFVRIQSFVRLVGAEIK